MYIPLPKFSTLLRNICLNVRINLNNVLLYVSPSSKQRRWNVSANRSPVITVNAALNATIGQEATLNVTTSDKDGDTVTLSLQSELPSGAKFNTETGIFTWTPSSMEAINIS